MLYTLTVAVNLIALGIAVWLGTYIITRSARSPVAWLAGITLWLMAGPYMNLLLALNHPALPAFIPFYMRPLLWFWPPAVFERGQGVWLQGWQVTAAYMTWHHATVLMRYRRMNLLRWVLVLAGYLVALIFILAQRHTDLIYYSIEGNPLDLSTLSPGRLHIFYVAALALFGFLALFNLIQSARSAPSSLQKKQFILMVVATLLAGLIALFSVIAYNFGLLIQRVVLTALLSIPICLIGYAVARYSALTEGRVIRRDFAYNGVSIALIAGIYFVVTWTSVKVYGVPGAAMVVVVILSILSHSLVDIARGIFDRFFYRRKTRELRLKLRKLVDQANIPDALNESLASALETLCGFVEPGYALILLFAEDRVELAASFHWRSGAVTLSPGDFAADDVTRLVPGKLPPPLDDANLLIPLYSADQQLGALVLGSPEHGGSYSEADTDRLLDASDRISVAIRDARRESANLARLAQLAAEPPVRIDLLPDLPDKAIEYALHNLSDYAYLADTPLAESPLIRRQLSHGQVTHLERGKAVHQAILDGIERMRPTSESPRDPSPREWYPYLILHDAYIRGISNRDIMLKLYISEGTFNRTRRSAIRSLARALNEMAMAVA